MVPLHSFVSSDIDIFEKHRPAALWLTLEFEVT